MMDELKKKRKRENFGPGGVIDHNGYWLSSTGVIKHCTHNATLLISNAPEWQGVLKFNEFTQEIIKAKPLPTEDHERESPAGLWQDSDDILASNWLNRDLLNLPTKAVREVIQGVALKNSFHPVRDYLDSCHAKWDGVPRLEQAATTYLGALTDSEDKLMVSRFAFKRWMISAVARIYKPGCKVDHMLILESDQGRMKSQALAVLGGEWFSDTPLDLSSKDCYIGLRGTWILEWGELAAMRNVEVERLKQFITSRKDTYRSPYGRSTTSYPREIVFAGTTNQDTYLKDPTGARRFWPIRCGKIDLDLLKQDRDQLWSEAVEMFKNGAEWWPTEAEHESLSDITEERYESDPWEKIIKEYVASSTRDAFTTKDILTEAISKDKQHLTRFDAQRVGAILRRMKFVRKRESRGQREWVYVKPSESVLFDPS